LNPTLTIGDVTLYKSTFKLLTYLDDLIGTSECGRHSAIQRPVIGETFQQCVLTILALAVRLLSLCRPEPILSACGRQCNINFIAIFMRCILLKFYIGLTDKVCEGKQNSNSVSLIEI